MFTKNIPMSAMIPSGIGNYLNDYMATIREYNLRPVHWHIVSVGRRRRLCILHLQYILTQKGKEDIPGGKALHFLHCK